MSTQKNIAASDRPVYPSLDFETLVAECKKDVDRGLLRANLKLTVEDRLLNLQAFIDAIGELRKAIKSAKQNK